MARRQGNALSGGLGDHPAQPEFLRLKGRGVHLHPAMRAVPSPQQLRAAPDLAREPGPERGRAWPPPGFAQGLELAEVEGGREPVGGPGGQVVGLVEEHEIAEAFLRGTEEAMQRGGGR